MQNLSITIRAASISTLLLVILLGCSKPPTPGAGNQVKKSIPKQRFHLPKTYPKGIARVRELFDVVNADGDLPEPITYQVLEIIHGTGAAAHSHFHLLEESTNVEMDDHGHETTGKNTHTVVVDWSTELSDLAKRMPKIAVGGDMDEQTWLKVKDLSATLLTEFTSLFENSTDDQSKRDALRTKSESINQLITELETLIP